jgi:hypothetical protein
MFREAIDTSQSVAVARLFYSCRPVGANRPHTIRICAYSICPVSVGREPSVPNYVIVVTNQARDVRR